MPFLFENQIDVKLNFLNDNHYQNSAQDNKKISRQCSYQIFQPDLFQLLLTIFIWHKGYTFISQHQKTYKFYIILFTRVLRCLIRLFLFYFILFIQSLMKSQAKNKSGLVKKSMNITTNFGQVIKAQNKKSNWKSKTTKMTKTLTGKTLTSKPNMMTQDDIEKLFKNHSKEKQSTLVPTKVSTEVGDACGTFKNKDFVSSVKFLKIDDQYDKFLSGLPHSSDLFCNFDCIGAQPYDTDDLTTLFKNNYLVGKIIGEGAYATVRVAIYKPKQQKIALKIYEKSKIKDAQRKKSVIRQIKILQLLNHPNIVQIHDVVQTNNHLNIAMEYLPGLSLGTYLKAQPTGRISQKTCKKIFKQLSKALSYMHEMNIAHRDIKLQNIILDEDLNPKLIDFGFSTCIDPTQKMKIFCGTPSYMSPEVVQRKEYRGQVADIWALGVLLFVSLTGIFPFKGSTDQQLFKKICSADYPNCQIYCSPLAIDLIQKMLDIDSNQRIKAQQILSHPWFNEGRNDSSKKRHIQTSHEARKRVYTIVSNEEQLKKKVKKVQKIKFKQDLNKTDKKFLAQTCKENLNLQLRMALKSPTNKQIASFRKKTDEKKQQKQNVKYSLKNEKNMKGNVLNRETFMKQIVKDGEGGKRKQKLQKTQPKVMDLLRMEIKKRQGQNSKSKNNTHRS